MQLEVSGETGKLLEPQNTLLLPSYLQDGGGGGRGGGLCGIYLHK